MIICRPLSAQALPDAAAATTPNINASADTDTNTGINFFLFCSSLYIHVQYLDVRMDSPPISPQGASRMTGGVLRGRALGNVFNYADGKDEPHVGPRKGKVLVYQSPRDPTTHKPDMSITSDVSSQLKPVLKTLGRKYSPVRSMFFFLYNFFFKMFKKYPIPY